MNSKPLTGLSMNDHASFGQVLRTARFIIPLFLYFPACILKQGEKSVDSEIGHINSDCPSEMIILSGENQLHYTPDGWGRSIYEELNAIDGNFRGLLTTNDGRESELIVNIDFLKDGEIRVFKNETLTYNDLCVDDVMLFAHITVEATSLLKGSFNETSILSLRYPIISIADEYYPDNNFEGQIAEESIASGGNLLYISILSKDSLGSDFANGLQVNIEWDGQNRTLKKAAAVVKQ